MHIFRFSKNLNSRPQKMMESLGTSLRSRTRICACGCSCMANGSV